MADTIGEAFVTIRPDTKGFEQETESKIGGAFKTVAKVGAAAFAGLTVAAVGFGRTAVAEGTEAAQAMGQTEAAIKSTGGAANVTSQHISNLAGRLGVLAGVDDEAVQAGQNLLLTFTSIRNEAGKGNDIFDQASKAMLDISARMGTDASGAAIQLGKALNDPIKGVTALTRIGVSFTAEQKKQITTMVEAGNILGAQKIILAELNTEFGGSAEAMGKNIAPGERLRLLFNNVAEEVGGSLIPVLNSLLPAITPVVVALGPALGTVAEALAPLLATIAKVIGEAIVPVIQTLMPGLSAFIGALGQGLTFALVGVAPLLGALANVLGIVLKALAPLLPVLGQLIGALATALVPILNAIAPLLGVVAGLISALVGVLAPLIEVGVRVLTVVLKPIMAVFQGIADVLKFVVDRINGFVIGMGKVARSLPDWLKPGSPSPLEETLWGIGRAFRTIGQQAALPALGMPALPRAAGMLPAPVAGVGAPAGTVLQVNLDGETVARVVYDQLLRMQRQQGPLFAGT